MGSGLGFGVLGPLELTREAKPVPVNGPKLRVVLAALLLRANATVSIDRLMEHLWGEHPPATARKSTQLYALRLRRVLGDDNVIETRSDGYALRLRPEQLDLLRFRQLRKAAQDAGDPAAELDLLASALRCWRGAALDDIPSESLQREYAGPLAEERLQARERYLEVCLELGRHREVIGLLGRLTSENPWQESFWELLLLALHRSGRLADALETYRTVHRMFTEELGVEPGPRLRQLHQLVLATDPAPGAEHAVPLSPLVGQLPADLPSFSGRSEDLAALDALLSLDRDRVLAVVGPGGIGKTALAVHWAHRVRDRFPDGQLFVDLRGYASTSPVSSTQALTLCLLALGVPARHVPATVEEQIVLYRASLAGRRVLVVLDNAADADQVRPLLPSSPGCVALVASRGDLRGLTVLNDARVLGLDVLTPSDARALLAELLGPAMAEAEPAAVDQLAELCGHLPLALRIAAANLVGGKHASISEYAAALRNDRLAELAIVGDPGVAVRATFQLSYAALDEQTRRVFRLLGRVPGPDFSAAAACAVTGTEGTRRSLDLLVSASLLTRRTSQRYQFHDLVREYASVCASTDEPPADRTSADMRLYEHYLRTADAATALLFPTVRRLISSDVDAPVHVDDKEAALRWLDDERVNLVAAVERGVATEDLHHYCGLLADVLRGYFAIRGHAADGLALSTAALTAARAAADRRAEVAALVLRGLIFYNLSDYEQATTQLGLALEANRHALDPRAEVECLHYLGRVYSQLGRPRDSMSYHEQALALAREIGDESIEARETNYVGVALLSLGRINRAIACHRKVLEISRRIGDWSIRTPALNGLGLAYWTAGRLAEAADHHQECVDTNDREGLPLQATAALVCLAETCCDQGRYEEAEAHAREALTRGQQLGERRLEGGALEVLATVQRRQGRLAESIQGYTAALQLARKINFRYGEVSVLIGLAAAHRMSGRPADAVTHVELALAKMNETGMRVLECAALIELAADHLALGDRATVAQHATHALDIAREDGQRLNEARARHVLGLLHNTRGEPAEAQNHWRTAVEILTDIGAPEAREVSHLLVGC